MSEDLFSDVRAALAGAGSQADGDAALARIEDLFRSSSTLLERATFDAHDREWSRDLMGQIRQAVGA